MRSQILQQGGQQAEYLPDIKPTRSNDRIPRRRKLKSLLISEEQTDPQIGMKSKNSFNSSYDYSMNHILKFPKIEYGKLLKKHQISPSHPRCVKMSNLCSQPYFKNTGKFTRDKYQQLSMTEDNPEFVNWKYRPFFKSEPMTSSKLEVHQRINLVGNQNPVEIKKKREFFLANLRKHSKSRHLQLHILLNK